MARFLDRMRARGLAPGVAGTGRLVAAVLRLLGSTWRVQVRGEEHRRAASDGGARAIYSMWHGRLLPLAYLYRGLGAGALVSRHRDGEYLTHALEALGFRVSRGSSGGGGAEGLLGMRDLGRVADLAITPDGPRGPAGVVAPGILALAQHTGLPIVPMGCVARPAWYLSTWDRFMVPRPFARVEVRFGEPFHVPPDLDAAGLQAAAARLAEAMAGLCAGEPGEPAGPRGAAPAAGPAGKS